MWPLFILGLVLFAVALGVWTIKVAIDNPVELDNSFFMDYQKVDEEYYKIEQIAKEFEKKYRVELVNKKLKSGEETLIIVVEDREGNPVPNGKVEILVTRPNTSQYDQKVEAVYRDGWYEARVTLPLEGRWDIIAKVTVGDLYHYYKWKRSTRRIIEDNLKKS